MRKVRTIVGYMAPGKTPYADIAEISRDVMERFLYETESECRTVDCEDGESPARVEIAITCKHKER